jgi:membrane fusion protein (multidrug efflux system)
VRRIFFTTIAVIASFFVYDSFSFVSMKRFFKPSLAIVVVILVIIAGVFFQKTSSSKSSSPPPNAASNKTPKAIPVEGYIARLKPLTSDAISSGTLLANEETEIKPEITGRIISIGFEEGQNVAKGALLVKLYDGDLQAQLKRAEAQKTLYERNLERNIALSKIQSNTQQDLDAAQSQLDAAKADIEVIRANLVKTEIRAAFSGKVGLRNVSVGAVVTPAQVMTNLEQSSLLKMDFTLPEKYSNDVKVGDNVRFTVESRADTMNARVYAVDSRIDPTTRTLRIRARFDNARGLLSPGAFAHVKIQLKEKRSILVPTQAIIPQTRGKSVIIAQDGKAAMRPVETGLRTADKVEIVSGLQEGDTVVTKGVMFIKPDMPLNFTVVN